ncbi:hypothetical protein FQN57_004272 [Myotisia sp. PD_48]|nr:hypothetical protein FQN57_004272 [Myotisia sp. PD_48]
MAITTNTNSSAIQLQDWSPVSTPRLEEEREEEEAGANVILHRTEHEFSLPRADGGLRAWLFLAGCFLVEALVWGMPFSYGLFQDFYSITEPFKSKPSGLPAIGTTALAVMYLGSPLCFAAMQRWPLLLRWSPTFGVVCMVLSMICSSFATEVWHLILTQGVMYGVGGSLMYNPVILYVDEWFIRRKGLAFGVMWAGTGFSGVTFPFLMSWLLNRYSLQVTLLAWGVLMGVISIPLLFIIRPRIPESRRRLNPGINLQFMKTRTFMFIQLGNVIQGVGYFMPTIYLPTYARSLGLQNTMITVTLALLNGAAVFGCIFIGVLTDRFHVTTVILISTLGATVAIFAMWGTAVSIPVLCIFSIVYGFFGGGFTTTYAGVVTEMRKSSNEVNSGLVVGTLAAGRGIGSLICGPLSEALVKGKPWQGQVGLGYGSGFGPLIVFAGVSSLFGGVSYCARRMGWLK